MIEQNEDFEEEKEELEELEEEDLLNYDITEQRIISNGMFIILYLATFGTYGFWWIYKSWKLFNEKDNLGISPAWRTNLSIFYLKELFDRILDYANEKDVRTDYIPLVSAIFYLIFSYLLLLPSYYFILTFLSLTCILPQYRALHESILKSDDIPKVELTTFNGRQIGLLSIGGLIWFVILMNLCLVLV